MGEDGKEFAAVLLDIARDRIASKLGRNVPDGYVMVESKMSPVRMLREEIVGAVGRVPPGTVVRSAREASCIWMLILMNQLKPDMK